MTYPHIADNTVWYAVVDSAILERVVVIGSVIFPNHGKYILYRFIDWPENLPRPHPHCLHESTFLSLYTPQEAPCENTPSEKSSSKISLPRPLPWYTALLVRWEKVTSPLRKSW